MAEAVLAGEVRPEKWGGSVEGPLALTLVTGGYWRTVLEVACWALSIPQGQRCVSLPWGMGTQWA